MEAYAVMALADSWTKPRFVSQGLARLEVFRTKNAARRRRKEMVADKTLVFRPWNRYDDIKADTRVDWVVCKVWIETVEPFNID